MNWTTVLLVVAVIAVIAVIFLLGRVGQVSADDARALLKNGALLLDVRSSGEFSSGHLPGAVNIPLDQLAAVLPEQVTDQGRALLLYCLSGTRSGIAKSQIKRMGYANVYNLGSISRAQTVVGNSPARPL